MNNIFKCAILAAGIGERLQSKYPYKPLAEVQGKTLIEHSIERLSCIGAQSIHILFNESFRANQEFLEHKILKLHPNIFYDFKDTPSSLHTLYNVVKSLKINKNEHLLVSMVDTLVKKEDFLKFIDECNNLNPYESMLLITKFIEDEKPLTLSLDENGYVEQFNVAPKKNSKTLVTSGIYCFSYNAINYLEQFVQNGMHKMRNFLSEIQKRKIKIKTFTVEKTLDIDRLEDIYTASSFLEQKLEYIIFDFGGCLDSNGLHTRDLYVKNFLKYEIITNDEIDKFQQAYTLSDQKLIEKSLVLKSNLFEMNYIMSQNIIEFMNKEISLKQLEDVSKQISNYQKQFLMSNLKVIQKLQTKYKLGIISNFTGNLSIILEEFSLFPYFNFIIDSYHYGITKPDPKIFKLALSFTKCKGPNCLFVGDNPERDIAPAKLLGMDTALIYNEKRKKSSQFIANSKANYNITSLHQLVEKLI